MTVQSFLDIKVVVDLTKMLDVDGLRGLFLLNNAQHTVVQMFIEVLSIVECCRAGGTLASGVLAIAGEFSVVCRRTSLPAIGRRLLHTVHRSQMSLEHIGSVETLLSRRPRSRAKAADHGTFVMCQCMSILVILACEALQVVLASEDWAFFRSLGLMSQHMSFEILEYLPAFGVRAPALLGTILV